jgi:chromosome segregation ATPase
MRFATVFTEHYHPEDRSRLVALEHELEAAKLEAATRRREIEAARSSLQNDLEALRTELSRTQLRLDAAHDRLAPVSDIGPSALRLARGLKRIAKEHPRAAGAFKALARRGLRLLGRSSRSRSA